MKLKPLLQEILNKSFYIRDTLVRKEVFDKLPEETQDRILELKKEFDSLGYIDARTQIGPDQYRRQTVNQQKNMQSKTLQVFKIENEVKELLKTPEQKKSELDQVERKKLESRKTQLVRQVADLKHIYAHKLNSTRDNPAKKSLKAAEEELASIESKLGS